MQCSRWPKKVLHHLVQTYGEIIAEEKLAGIKSRGGCYRLRFADSSIIVKSSPEDKEFKFYTCCQPQLKATWLPKLYWAAKAENAYWLVMEDIPRPLPKSRWEADPAVIHVLASLHQKSWGKALPFSERYRPHWRWITTDKVLAMYSQDVRNTLYPLLKRAQKDAQRIFAPYCWVSADTNPANWGLRENGSLVLLTGKVSPAQPPQWI